ncbi:MAG: sel1 repeat family protein [Alphaproteobacteria bacterium]|nr:sel1 repeat family protein [Alphaproteobacteria bacterium]
MGRLIVLPSFLFLFGSFLFLFSAPVLAQGNGSFAALQKKAQSGSAEAQFNLGVIYEGAQAGRRDYGLAIRWYRRAAMQGLGQAQYNLGVMYTKGKGVPRNYVEAYKWLALAARTGTVPNAGLLGEKIAKKLTIEEEIEANRWIRAWKPVLER